jgi:hypothetical protein
MKLSTSSTVILASLIISPTSSFLSPLHKRIHPHNTNNPRTSLLFLSEDPSNQDPEGSINNPSQQDYSIPNEEGAALASELSKLLLSRNITSLDDVADEDVTSALGFTREEFDAEFNINDDDDDEDERIEAQDEELENAYLQEFTTRTDSEMSDEEFNKELDTNIKERMLSSPRSFVNLNLEVDMDLGEGEDGEEYKVPEKVPDSNLSAGEVVKLGELVLLCDCNICLVTDIVAKY